MRLMIREPEVMTRLKAAFRARETFRLEGAGLSVPCVCVSYNYAQSHFPCSEPSQVILDFEQYDEVKIADTSVPKESGRGLTRLHQIRNACSEIHQAVEHYNVSIDCSAGMRAVVEAMIDAGYRKP